MNYLLLVTLATALFYGGYWLLMRHETHFGMRRACLVGTLLLALTLPAIHLRVFLPVHFAAQQEAVLVSEVRSTPEVTMVTTQADGSGTLETDIQRDAAGVAHVTVHHSPALPEQPWWKRVLPWIWVAGCAVSALILILTTVRLRKMLRRLPYETLEEIKILGFPVPVRLSLVDDDTPAFSFGRHIVIGRKGFSDNEVQQLIGHELVHVRQVHTADLMLCHLTRVAMWFNPFVWLYERELKRVHEYIADRAMIQSDKGGAYAELFYHQLSGHLYLPLCNAFDYRIAGKRIAMMTKEPSKRKSLRWLAFVPIAAVILTVGCVQKNTLEGTYSVERMTLMSDNPEEPDLECSEFLGLKTRQFLFSRDGQVRVMDVDNYGIPQQCTYTIDDSGLHIYDSTGVPWLDMTLETRYCDKDSIVLRFVDNDPVRGLEKMLRGLPSYRYRVDTVTISSSGRDADGVPIEVNPHQETDTVFAQVVVHCPLDNDCHWNKGNRLLSASAPSVATFITEYTDEKGHKESLTGTYWEFSGDTLVSGAHDIYDTSRYLNPRLENDRFILEIVLKK